MQALKHTVEVVLDVTRRGGRLLERDAHTLLLADYEQAAVDSLALIGEQFPGTQITVCQSSSSSSGYIVIFHHAHARPLYATLSFVHGVLVCMVLSVYFSHFGAGCLMG